MVHRLREDEIASVLCGLSDELSDMALELRSLVLALGPQLDERIAFHALCYSVPGRPYGIISQPRFSWRGRSGSVTTMVHIISQPCRLPM